MAKLVSKAFIHINSQQQRALLLDTETSKTFEIPYRVALEVTSGDSDDATFEKLNLLCSKDEPICTSISAAHELFDLRFLLTNRCNFACSYCYADHGSYGLSPADMSTNIAQRALDYFHSQYSSIRQISLFGGEPLLMPKLIDFICTYAHELWKDCPPSFSVVTNASLLKGDVLSLVQKHNIAVVASIDGPRHVNDSQRVYADGSGSFETVDNNLRACRQICPLSIEATYTSNHVNERISRAALREYLSQRYETSRVEVIDVSVNQDKSDQTKLSVPTDMPEKLLDSFFDNPEHPYSDELFELMRVFILGRSSSYLCDAGIYKYTVAMNGDIYPCHLFVGDPRFLLGNASNKVAPKRTSLPTKNSEICQECSIRSYCSGCVFYIMRNPGFCERKKVFVSAFLHRLLDLLLTNRLEYDRLIQGCSDYGRKHNLKRAAAVNGSAR